MTKVQWPLEAQNVIVTGNFDNWAGTLPLIKNEDGIFVAHLPNHGWPLIFKFIVDGEWKTCLEYSSQTDDQGNVNNILDFALAQDLKESVKGQKPLDVKQTWPLPGIPEETSPEIRDLQLPKVLITDVNGVESDFPISPSMENNNQVPVTAGTGRVPRVILTNAEGKVSSLIVPDIVITDSNGIIIEEITDYLDTRAPMVNSCSVSSMDSVDSQTTLNTSQEDKSVKASKKYNDTFKSLKGLKKRTSRFMQSMKKSFIGHSSK